MTIKVQNWYEIKGISRKTMKADIQRGVKNLSEYAYSKYYGYTGSSVTFFNKVMGFNIGRVSRAEFTYKNGRYLVRLFTEYGFTIVFKGLGFGYYGEGARAAASIMEACGASKAQVNKVYTQQSNFKLYL